MNRLLLRSCEKILLSVAGILNEYLDEYSSTPIADPKNQQILKSAIEGINLVRHSLAEIS